MFFLSINVKNIGIPYGEMLVRIPETQMRVIDEGKKPKEFLVDTQGGFLAIQTKLNGVEGRLLLNLFKKCGYLKFPDQKTSIAIRDQSVENSSLGNPQLLEQGLPFLESFLDIIGKLINQLGGESDLKETKIVPAIRKRELVD